jgi:energy-coupling factor transporter ATP-binding protein EcfA2
MYVSSIYLKNIKCFEEFSLKFDTLGESVVFAADNGDGKTTILLCLAMGLCDESSAAALFRELKGDMVRKNQKEGLIRIGLKDRAGNRFETDTTIVQTKGFEWIRQEVYKYDNGSQTEVNIEDFPWQKIFVCGYGAGRQTRGTGDYSKYAAIDAVYTLFRYYEPHQNSELAFRRLVDLARKKGGRDPEERERSAHEMDKQLCDTLKGILNLAPADNVELRKRGIFVKSHWGDHELDVLGDGYKGMITWILDFLWWHSLFVEKELDVQKMSGVVLIDEVEQHLHPKWQQNIMQHLHEAFPKIQFISTTHSPLVVSGCKDIRVRSIKYGKPQAKNVYGWLAEDVYHEVMGLSDGTRAHDFKEKILDEFEKLDRRLIAGKANKSDLATRTRLRKLLAKLPESDPIGLAIEIQNVTKELKKYKKKN